MVRTKYFTSLPALAEYMGGFGYRLFGVYEQSSEADGTLAYLNALFVCEELIDQTAKSGLGGYDLLPSTQTAK